MKKPIYKKWWFWLIIVVVAIGIIGAGEEESQQETEEPIEEVKEADPESVEEEETEEPVEEDNRTIDAYLQEKNEHIDTATLEDGVLTIQGEGKTTFSENTLFRSVYDMFEVMHEAFQDESVNEVYVELTTTMVDQKGNESVDPVIKYNYDRATFEELNYDNFTSMAYSEEWRILTQANYYHIHPGIYKNLKEKYTDHVNVEGFN